MKRIPIYLFISSLLAILAHENGVNIIFLCVLFFIGFLFIKASDIKIIGIFCFLFFILVFFRMDIICTTASSLVESTEGLTYQGRINSFPIYREDKAQFILQVEGEKEEKIQAFIYKNTHFLSYGDVIQFTGKVKLPDGKRNPGGFDYKQYLRGKNIYALLYINDLSLKITNDHSLSLFERVISNFRKSFVEFIKANFTSGEVEFLQGLILGEKAVDPQIVDDFNKLGVSHILSVSGLHVGYVYIFVRTLCSMFRLSKRKQIIVVSGMLYIYCFMVGFSQSVIRASLMFVLLLLAEITNKKYDTLNVVCFLASVFIFINPYVIFDVGFQLSYSAVLCITIFYPYLNHKVKLRSKYLESAKSLLLLTVSVQLGTIPLVLYHFHNLSILSFVANLFIVPVSGFIIIGFLCVFFSSLLLHRSISIFMVPIKMSIHFILGISEALIKIPFAFMTLSPMPLFIVVPYYLIILLSFGYFYHYKEGHRKIVILLVTVDLSMILISTMLPKPLIVTFLDVGQGDSTLIQCPNNTNILIDGGGQIDYSVGDNIIAKVLLAKNIRKLDLVVCTHSDDDHKLGIIEIFDDVVIKSMVINCLEGEGEGYKDLISMAKQYHVPVFKNNTVKVNIDEDVGINFLYPNSETRYIDVNNSSVITKLTYREVSFLFTGDLGKSGEKTLMSGSEALKCDFIKIGHHGSKTSTGSEFLDMVNPRYGIISVGEDNVYNHPNMEVLDLLNKRGIHIFRTDKGGTIEVTSNGKNVQVKTYVD